jgi:hypothetical protein
LEITKKNDDYSAFTGVREINEGRKDRGSSAIH